MQSGSPAFESAESFSLHRTGRNFSQKLKRETLRYSEALELADAIGYELIWRKKEP